MCATMRRLLGERCEYADATERPDLLALTELATAPIYLVFDGEMFKGSFAGMMPVSLWERRVEAYK